MGGLIQDTLNDIQDGIPGIDRTPAGSLLTQKNVTNSKSELVIFLRPLVIRDPSIDGDYRAFRPFVPEDGFMLQPNPAQTSAGVNR